MLRIFFFGYRLYKVLTTTTYLGFRVYKFQLSSDLWKDQIFIKYQSVLNKAQNISPITVDFLEDVFEPFWVGFLELFM